ncbi:MAG: MFS transporter [Trebonia sp.]
MAISTAIRIGMLMNSTQRQSSHCYTLTFGGLLLLGGRAGDILGRRRMFMAGIAIFTLASLAGGLAPNAGVLLAARAIQGVGGALASPAVLALVVSAFPEGRERTKALGVYTGVVMGVPGQMRVRMRHRPLRHREQPQKVRRQNPQAQSRAPAHSRRRSTSRRTAGAVTLPPPGVL